MRAEQTRTELVRAGFQDLAAAGEGLTRFGEGAASLLTYLSSSADPDLALRQVLALLDALEAREGDEAALLRSALSDDEGTAMRLVGVLGVSEGLGEHLVRHPEQWRELRDPTSGSTRPAAWAVREGLMKAVGADPVAPVPVATLPHSEACDALRVEYRRVLLRLAARDVAHHMGMDNVAAELSELADGTLDAALAVARAQVGPEGADVRLAVVAMGKCGGHELNYVSDVDVIFVHEPVREEDADRAGRVAAALARSLIAVCSDNTREGTIWPVDPNLRPEGRNGPLSRTLASHRGYYERWAKTWEFQALLKARAVAGDKDLGRAYVEMTAPMVWQAAEREGFVADTRAMRRRVLEHIPDKDAPRQLKLGSGGLRDVEFAVQLLQLVHGRSDPAVRAPTTLSALHQLTRGGYVARQDGEALHEAYCFLRTLEHRIQLHRLRRTHVVPRDEESLRRLGRSMGYFRDPARTLEEEWARRRRLVGRLHEKLFYRPLLEAVARIPGTDARLTTAQAADRLAALGYADPRAALRHLEAMTRGVSRSASIQRTLLPVMLEWFADSPDPDAGLFGFRRISAALGETHWYLRALRDEGQVAERLARVLSTSPYATDLLEREPQGVRILGEDLTPLDARTVRTEMLATARRQASAADAVRAVRAIRRRELFRVAVGEMFAGTDVTEVGRALTSITHAALEATLDAVLTESVARRGLDTAPVRMAIVAMGRLGGCELSYASDADVMFVHEPVAGADPQVASEVAFAVANEVRSLLAAPATDPPLELDADLRPEGRQGPLVRSLESYATYYARWSKVWEAQALLRAHAAVGDRALCERFTALVDPLRYPADGISAHDVVEIRRIKARVDHERLPRGADPKTHFKLGRGGLADIEWTVQLLQMQHAGRVESLRTPVTLDALAAATRASLVDPDDAAALAEAWRVASRMRNAATLVRGKGTDQLPRDPKEKASMAIVLGHPDGNSEEMVNEYLRTTRHARQAVERIFWG